MTRVLIVDDKAENLYYLRALLTGHGHAVESARDGAEALAKARQAPPELIISDLLMPVMDGYTLLRNWKSDARLRPIPFIVYTATYTAPEDEELALGLGADAFIVKPCEPEDFIARIRLVEASAANLSADRTGPRPETEEVLVKQYNEVLVRKLESKLIQLDDANQALQREMAERRHMAEIQSAILDALPADIVLLNSDGMVLAVNESWRRSGIVGGARAAEYKVGANYLDAWVGAREEQMREEGAREARDATSGIGRVLRGELPEFTLEYPCQSDGGQRWFRLTVTPLSGDRSRGAVVMHVDITDRLDLQHRLAQSQKLEALGQLTGGMAHDFNNLLGVIIGNLDLVHSLADMPRDAGELVDDARDAALRGSELTRSLLAFARRQPLRPQIIDINDLVDRIAKLLRRTLGERIEFALHSTTDLWSVAADPAQLEAAITNLATNARDAMQGGGVLTIEARNVCVDAHHAASNPGAIPGEYVMLAVGDTGSGIPPEIRDQIFEPFFTTKSEGKGSGLGLSMVFGFIQQSGGHIAVESVPGKGSVFRLYLPRCEDKAAVRSEIVAQPPVGGSETILVVEDNEKMRMIVIKQLERLGYRVLAADSAAAALEIIASPEAIDLLFTDIVMPGQMDGVQLASEAKTRRRGLKVLLTSGFPEGRIADHEDALSSEILLSKPYRKDELARTIRGILDDAGERTGLVSEGVPRREGKSDVSMPEA